MPTATLPLAFLFAYACAPGSGSEGTGGETTTKAPDLLTGWRGATRDSGGRVLFGGESFPGGGFDTSLVCPLTLSAESGGPFTLHHIDDGAGPFQTLTHLGSTFLAKRYPQGVSRSVDGLIWEHVLDTESSAVLVVDDLALVVGPLAEVSTSTDGLAWTPAPLPGHDPDRNAAAGLSHTTAFGFVVNDASYGPIAHSADGVTWEAATVVGLPFTNHLVFGAPILDGTRLVMSVVEPAYAHTDATYNSLVSLDGSSWTFTAHQDVETPGGVEFAGRFWRMDGLYLYSSADGAIWVEEQGPYVGSQNGLLADGDRLLVYGNEVWSSADGAIWELEQDGDSGPCAD